MNRYPDLATQAQNKYQIDIKMLKICITLYEEIRDGIFAKIQALASTSRGYHRSRAMPVLTLVTLQPSMVRLAE